MRYLLEKEFFFHEFFQKRSISTHNSDFLLNKTLKHAPAAGGFGIIIGILWVFPHELVMAGAHHGKSIAYVFKNAAWHMVEQGLGGIITGLIFGKINV
ncbi:MAG: hypothetical protein GY754_17090 [bacterium]|nr:hypothetical protein [bacterium]